MVEAIFSRDEDGDDDSIYLYFLYKELIWDRCNKLKRTLVNDGAGGGGRVIVGDGCVGVQVYV